MYIVVTGLDGAGKTSLVESLSRHYRCSSIRFPYCPQVYEMIEISGYGKEFDDSWTDRLIFALDNRLANYDLENLLKNNADLISQRGWMDSFIHGAVQGYSYAEMMLLNRPQDLTRPDASIYLTCKPEIAWQRIQGSDYMDKYETKQYLTLQYHETIRFYENAGSQELDSFSEARLHLDTTEMTIPEVHAAALSWIKSLGGISS